MLETTIKRAAGGNAWRRLGKIKLGVKVPIGDPADGKSRPQDLEYFVIPDAYKETLGEKPQELSIVLANPDLRQNFDSRAVMYLGNGSKACHTEDDRTAHRYMKVPGGDQKYRWCDIACPNVECEYRLSKQCQERGYFSFMVPACGEIGVFLLILASKVGITQIYTALKVLESLCVGRPNGMAGIRLKLRRERKEFFQDFKGTGQQSKVVKWIPMVEIDFASLLADDKRRLGPMLGQPVLLPSFTGEALALDSEYDLDDEQHEGQET